MTRVSVFTHSHLSSIMPGTPPFSVGDGLMFFPKSKKGHGRWMLRYSYPTYTQQGIRKLKRAKKTLGHFPELSLKQARENAFKFLNDLEASESDGFLKKESCPTFEEAAYVVHQRLLPKWKNKKHGQQWINTLKTYAFPYIGVKKLKEITAQDIERILAPIWSKKAETAKRVRQRISEVLKWGISLNYCNFNPVHTADALLPVRPPKSRLVTHHPSLPWQDIPSFLHENHFSLQPSDMTRALLLFIILTACRLGEARDATWEEIDWETKVWTIPAIRMKNSVEHSIPLSRQSIAILKHLHQLGLHSSLIFPNPQKLTPMSDMALTIFLRKKNAKSDTPNRFATTHGFRSSFRNWCAENMIPAEIAERALSHAIGNQVEAAYNRTKLLEQRRPHMQTWADYVCSLIVTD